MTTVTATETDVKMTPWWLVLLEGIAAVIVGVLLLTDPRQTMVILIQVLGIYWFIAGIFKIVSIFIDSTMWGWKLFAGILGILAGIIIINHPLWSPVLVQATVVLLLGIDGIIIGIVSLVQAFKGGGWGIGILGVLSIIFGVILLANLWMATFALSWVVGIFAIIGGIFAIIMAFRLR
jgi:uncharacterized membrane protein HdeD (DUF308 family)